MQICAVCVPAVLAPFLQRNLWKPEDRSGRWGSIHEISILWNELHEADAHGTCIDKEHSYFLLLVIKGIVSFTKQALNKVFVLPNHGYKLS